MRRGCQRSGNSTTSPAEMAEIMTVPAIGSKRKPVIVFSGWGFSQAHSQFTHGPSSAGTTRVWLQPHDAATCSWPARHGWGL